MRLRLSFNRTPQEVWLMIVCLCAGSRERDIERAVEAGARNLSEIGGYCRAGLGCGGCRSALLGILHRRSCENCPNRDRGDLGPCLEQVGKE